MLKLADPVTKVPLIGPKYKNRLKKLGVETVEDLLYHVPSRYDDYSNIKKISQLIVDEPVTVIGQLKKIENIFTSRGKKLTKGILADETGQILLVWFNQHFITRTLKAGDWVSISGKMGEFDRGPAMVGPEYEKIPEHRAQSIEKYTRHPELDSGSEFPKQAQPPRFRNKFGMTEGEQIHTGRLVPVYPETRGISSKWLRSRINHLFNVSIHRNIEFLPQKIRETHELQELSKAIREVHFPRNHAEKEKARKRIAFDELFLLQISALKRRREWKSHKTAAPLSFKDHFSPLKEFAESLPFKLTEAQKRAAREILKDLAQDKPMNRLLEGDVGSGKTVVAALATYTAVLNETKVLYMAPTEILAEQQYKTLKNYLDPLKIKTAIVTGSKKPKEEEWNVMVGTHALLFKRKFPKDLSLIVIDEQHRFGVEQRANLLKKTEGKGLPHLLTMTATPIPRTMALTLYGDLDLSYIDEMPLGRKNIKTFTVPKHKREDAYRWIEKQIATGDQAFIICPLIEESESETMKSVKAVTAEFEALKKIFPRLSLGLLHGRLKSKEKDQIITGFRDKKYDILVSTPVVEVGIDIPNATIMIIEAADRFGLASLHQLRGRVGRGEKQSYCLLFTESKSEKTRRRLEAMEKTNDGVKLAEMDLELRGPGEIYGTKQHGIPELKVASLSNLKLIEKTRREAEKIIEEDPKLSGYETLKEKVGRMGGEDVAPN